jgi:hypothetical protein
MERILIVAVLTMSLGATAPEAPESEVNEAAAAEQAPERETTIPPGEDFGQGLTLNRITEFKDVIHRPENYAGQRVLIRARVYDVCQKKGCWMALRDGDVQVRVRFKDYDFFVPKDCTGQLAYAEGHVKAEKISEKTARHYAKESGRGNPSEIRGPQQVVSFIATGVRLVSSE